MSSTLHGVSSAKSAKPDIFSIFAVFINNRGRGKLENKYTMLMKTETMVQSYTKYGTV